MSGKTRAGQDEDALIRRGGALPIVHRLGILEGKGIQHARAGPERRRIHVIALSVESRRSSEIRLGGIQPPRVHFLAEKFAVHL